MKAALILAFAALLQASGPVRAEESVDEALACVCDRPVRFGFSPYLTAGLLRSAFEPVIQYLGVRLGVPIELVIPEHYADVLTLIRQGTVDLVYLTPALYVKARRVDPRLRLLVTDVWHGVDFYTGYLVVRANAGFDSLENLRGRRVAYVDRDSTSGYLLPRAELRRRGLQPDSFFGEVRFSGDHLRSLELLLNGEVDVAALSSDTLATARRQRRDVGAIRILLKTGKIPHDVICATATLADDVAARLTALLLALNCRTREGRAILPKVPRLNGWRAGDPTDYDEIERLLDLEEGATP